MVSITACEKCPPPTPPQGDGPGWDLQDLGEALIQARPENHPWKNRINSDDKPLRGFVDLHTHPMAHLGFGGKVYFGSPDDTGLMPAGTITCDPGDRPANGIAEALGSCHHAHFGWHIENNKCGNLIRNKVLDAVQTKHHNSHSTPHPQGHPTLQDWPRYNDILHQSMHHTWLRRAYDGGLRVIVALAVNNRSLAKGVDGNEPIDDVSSANLQIKEMQAFVGKHDFMEIAYTAADVRRIVGKEDKLAVVLGIEIDDIGNWKFDRRGLNVTFADADAIAEVQRLHGLGVRYVFPVHATDNMIGGAAVYEYPFTIANRYQSGHWFDLECAPLSEGINKKLVPESDDVDLLAQTTLLGFPGEKQPIPVCTRGHRNKRGLTGTGKVVIDALMKRGMLIDIDHMSSRTVSDVLAFTEARQYPLVAGHNGIRDKHAPSSTERQLSATEIKALAARKGMVGVGFAKSTAFEFTKMVNKLVVETGVSVAIGSDANGLSPLAGPRPACAASPCVAYSSAFPRSQLGPKTWNYNTDGVAHYGLLPDFLRDVAAQPSGVDAAFFLLNGPEAFAAMWERAEAVGAEMSAP